MAAETETELKLIADAAGIAAIVGDSALFGGRTETRQISTYFDAPDLPLAEAGLSLRIRAIGERRIQTVKAERATVAGLFARAEWERDVSGDLPEPGDVAEALGGAAPDLLAPVFRTEVERVKTVFHLDDSRIEMVADRGRVVAEGADGATTPIGEIELELLSGDPAALFGLARRIARVAPVRIGVESKSERGYALLRAKPDKAAKAEPVRSDRGMDAAALFAAVAGACLRHYRLNEDRLIATGGAEPLHQARVALRRLRSAFTTFHDILDGPEHERLRAELRWLAALLGDVRNIDVLLPRIADPDARDRLAKARAEALAIVMEAIESARVRDLMLDLAEWAAFGAWRGTAGTKALRATPARDYAAAKLDRLRRRLRRRGRDLATLDDDARHEVRIIGKKMRYAAEFFAGLFPAPKRVRRRGHFLGRLEGMQAALGDLNDLASGRALLTELGFADVERLLDAGDRAPPMALLAAAGKAHDSAMDEKRFWK